jgi:hypothetical protein
MLTENLACPSLRHAQLCGARQELDRFKALLMTWSPDNGPFE